MEPVQDLSEAAADPHLTERGMWPEVAVPLSDGVQVTQMGNPLHLSACPPRYRHAGYPEGHHTEEILAGLGYSGSEIRDMST